MLIKYLNKIIGIFFLTFLSFSFFVSSQEINRPNIKIYKGEIVNIIDNQNNAKDFVVKVSDLNGENIITNTNGLDYKIGTKVYIENRTENDGSSYWLVTEAVRIDTLSILGALFIVIVVALFGWKGVKSLISLLVSFLIIFYVLIPLTLKGFNPLIIAAVVASMLLFSVMILTHGWNRVTISALLGCAASIFITIIIAYLSVTGNKITGFSTEEAAMLFYNANNVINFELLAIASIIIGVIGVIDDGAITQAGLVAELKSANPNLSLREYYRRAMRVGASHAGAMINTLILAYTGASLTLLLLIKTSQIDVIQIINKEIIAIEIIRSIVGSIGILLCIPLTTLFAVYLVKKSDAHLEHGHHH